ncbi:hypothetical protein EYF80_027162 [Liparis tanakae]|uniref:Uncharacterized protein n=1 Tax=Liparis tanakae TaxID=230148 RepID=A0A4Z2HC27_9TELE|nr:hypothetical protein EYF80_027162 [Liparis tanakae]
MCWCEANVENNVSENSDIRTSMSKRGSISIGAAYSICGTDLQKEEEEEDDPQQTHNTRKRTGERRESKTMDVYVHASIQRSCKVTNRILPFLHIWGPIDSPFCKSKSVPLASQRESSEQLTLHRRHSNTAAVKGGARCSMWGDDTMKCPLWMICDSSPSSLFGPSSWLSESESSSCSCFMLDGGRRYVYREDISPAAMSATLQTNS